MVTLDYPIGMLAMLAETNACYCGGQPKHWHAVEKVWDGSQWLATTSQAGIEFMAALRDKVCNERCA